MSERDTYQFYKGLSWKTDLFMLNLPSEIKTEWIARGKKKEKGKKAKMHNTGKKKKKAAIEFCISESL